MPDVLRSPEEAVISTRRNSAETTAGAQSQSCPDLETGRETDIVSQKQEVDNGDFLVQFGPDDPEDPKNWSSKMKWSVTIALSVTGFNRTLVSLIMAPAISTIAEELHLSTVQSTMALSVFLLATAFGPMLLGPLSEIYGRKSLIHITNLWFLAWNLVCGFANSGGLLIASRLLAGFAASAVYTLSYGVLGDVWRPEQRGVSLSLYLLIPLTGAAVGPILGGFIVEYSTWRWMFWATSILQGVAEVGFLPLTRETYAPLLLRRRAAKLRKDTGDERYHAAIEKQEAGRSQAWKLRNNLSRPIRLLAFHPIVQIQALLGGVNYGLLYFALTSFSTLYVTAYGESKAISGLHYIAICTGEIVGAVLNGPLIDYVYKALKARAGGEATPELRVPLFLPCIIFTPIGFLLYGWAAEYRLFWLVTDIGAFVLGAGWQVFDTTLRAHVIDSYPDHVGSASAANQLLKSLFAFGFPLFADQMYEAIGYGWGNSLLALLSVVLCIPSTWVLWKFGARLRAKKHSSY